MRFSPMLATLLFIITRMSLVHATHGPVTSCCPGWSTTRVPVKNIVKYSIQSEGVCSITAIVFHTKLGKRICSSPHSEWAKKAILEVDEEAKGLQRMGISEEGSTSDVTPQATTAKSKKARWKKSRKGGRRQRVKSRRRMGKRKRA